MERRDFLNGIITGLGATAWPFSKSLALTTNKTPTPEEKLAENTPFILRIHCDGGWDQTCVFDFKGDIDTIHSDPLQTQSIGAAGIRYVSHPSRPSVDQFFMQHGNKASIINGIYCNSIERNESLVHSFARKARNGVLRDYLEYYSSLRGTQTLAPHVAIDTPYLPGETNGHIFHLIYDKIVQLNTVPNLALNMTATESAQLETFIRSNHLGYTQQLRRSGIDHRKMSALNAYRLKHNDFAYEMTQAYYNSFNAADSFLLQRAKFALQLFSQKLSKSATVPSTPKLSWDSVTNNFPTQSLLFENLFADLMQIIQHATTLGLADRLIILVTSESGRAPHLNASSGKNRWSYTSMLAWGKYIRPGSVVGRTDDFLRGVRMNPVFETEEGERNPITLDHVFAALYFAASINYRAFLPGTDFLSPMIDLG